MDFFFYSMLNFYSNFRNGVELPPIAKDDSYDFNYQRGRIHNPEKTVRIGDELMTVCEYTSSQQNRPVLVSFVHVCIESHTFSFLLDRR